MIILGVNFNSTALALNSDELVYMLKGRDWKVTASGFYSDWKDGVLTMFDPSISAFINKNEVENRAFGGEANLIYTMSPFVLDFGLAYVKSKAIDSRK